MSIDYIEITGITLKVFRVEAYSWSLLDHSQLQGTGNSLDAYQRVDGYWKCGRYTPWDFTQL